MASGSGLKFFKVRMQDIGTPWPLENYCDADPISSGDGSDSNQFSTGLKSGSIELILLILRITLFVVLDKDQLARVEPQCSGFFDKTLLSLLIHPGCARQNPQIGFIRSADQ